MNESSIIQDVSRLPSQVIQDTAVIDTRVIMITDTVESIQYFLATEEGEFVTTEDDELIDLNQIFKTKI